MVRIDMALNYPHNGGQVPLFPPQTLLTSAVASFPNLPFPPDETEPPATPELIFVPSSTETVSDVECEAPDSSSHDSKGTNSLGDEKEKLGDRELESLLDLWMIAKIREASTSLSSLISNLYREKLLLDAARPSVFTVSGQRWRDAPRRIHSWVTHRTCTWMGLCDVSRDQNGNPREGSKSKPSDWAGDARVLGEIPSYVLEHAPYVHLFSKEQYWPSDISEHLNHITPELNYTPILPSSEHPTLTDLDELNQWEQGLNVYLTSNENVETSPDWLESRMNIPRPLPGDDGGKLPRTKTWPSENSGDSFDRLDDADGHWRNEENEAEAQGNDDGFDAGPEENISGWARKHTSRREPGRSEAPAVLVVVEKGEGIVDAFWFYFYSFNQGNQVFNIRFGDHVGDWEHTLVRFENGEPISIFCSEHSFGEAFTYNAAEKIGKRPVVYSATGSHAMYSSPGIHAYVLPFGLLHDETDRGPLWDPALNSLAYTYDYQDDRLLASTLNPQAPISWFYFGGRWGDKIYPLSDDRQYTFAGQYHYVSGPLGPRFKNLGRKNVCQGDDDPCLIKRIIGGDTLSWQWNGVGEGEEMSDEDYQRFFGKRPSVEVPPFPEN